MESFEIVLLLLGCVLVSSIFDQVFSRLAMPLVQIALGAVVGFFIVDDPSAVISEPEMFLLIFIAPLLFDESRHADKSALWKNKGHIISLAIGLVFITSLVVGFVLNLLVPSIPLAAAFALGAALGPTDAAAVAAMGKDVKLTDRQKSLLSGEALFNDASGVVAFEFAIAAAVTGAFSLLNATATFLFDFVGGVVVGLALAAIVMFVLGRVRSLGLETPTVFLLFEVIMPFFAYLTAEHFGVSGILAVVAAALFMKFYPSSLTLESSRYAVASENVWELLVFAINGIVFVLLGMKLPEVILPTWNSSGHEGGAWLIVLIVIITAIVIGVRFAWVVGMEKLARNHEGARPKIDKEFLRNAAVVTLAGPKGAVTLSVVMSLPYFISAGTPFPNRDLLIFLASGVIVLTLLIANFVVPLLAPAEEGEGASARSKVEIDILQNVVDGLLAKETPETAVPTRIAVQAYHERMNLVREREVSDEALRDLRINVLESQLGFVEGQMKAGEVGRAAGERYASTISHTIDVLRVRRGSKPSSASAVIGAGAPLMSGTGVAPGAAAARTDLRKKAPFAWTVRFVVDKVRGSNMSEAAKRDMMHLIIASEEHALRYLEEIEPTLDAEGRHAAGLLKSEYGQNLMAIRLRTARAEAEAAEEAREEAREAVADAGVATPPDSTAKLEALSGVDIPEVTPESRRVLDAVEKREAQLEAVIAAPSATGTIPFVGQDLEDADLATKVSSAANAVVDAASVASAALAGEETHTGRKVRGTFLGRRRVKAKTRDIEAEALAMELEQIQLMREAGRLSNADARELREEVYMLQMGLEAR